MIHANLKNIATQITIAGVVLFFSLVPWGIASIVCLPLILCLIWKKHAQMKNWVFMLCCVTIFNVLPFLYFCGTGVWYALRGTSHLTSGGRGCEDRNLIRDIRLYPGFSGCLQSGFGTQQHPSMNFGITLMIPYVGPGKLSHLGNYPTKREAKAWLISGTTSNAEDIEELSTLLEINKKTTKAIVAQATKYDECRRWNLVGIKAEELYTPDYIEYKHDKREVRWARCGKDCLVLSPLLSGRLSGNDFGTSIFLVNTKTSTIFARYIAWEYDSMQPIYK